MKILLVDDDEALLQELASVCERRGYEVRTAESAESALQIYKEGGIALVVTDLVLPGKSGLDLLLRLQFESDDPLVIAMSALSAGKTEWLSLAEKMGAAAVMQKPFDGEQLILTMQSVLERCTTSCDSSSSSLSTI